MFKALLALGIAISIGWTQQVAAQADNGFEEAVRLRTEEERQRRQEEEARASGARNAAASAAAVEQGRRIVASVNAMPVLPAARNPLFGKWMIEASLRPKPKENDLFGQLAQMSSLTCRLMFSDGIVNFKPGEWSLDDSAGDESLGPITYRSNGAVIAVVPARGINALVFEVRGKDRMVELRTGIEQDPCVLIRVPQTTTYATRPRVARPATATSNSGPTPPGQPMPQARVAPPVSRQASLLTLNDLSGYQCPDGAKLVVQSCYSGNEAADCSVVQAHLPPRNGYQITARETRGEVAKKVSSCRVSKVMVNAQGMVVFLP